MAISIFNGCKFLQSNIIVQSTKVVIIVKCDLKPLIGKCLKVDFTRERMTSPVSKYIP